MEASGGVFCLLVLLRSALSVSLTVEPNRCRFVLADSVSFSCGDVSGNWTVFRNTTEETFSVCGKDWGKPRGLGCKTRLVLFDSGLYWCESEGGVSSEASNITVTRKLEPNVSTACPTPSPPSTTTTASPPHPRQLLWPVLGCGLGVLLGLVLVLLGLTVKRCRRRAEQDGRLEEITYSKVRVSHDRRRPVKRGPESEPSPVYSTVKTEKDKRRVQVV